MKKSRIILISVFSIVVVVLGIALVNIDSLLEKYIKEELDRIIDTSDDGIYNLKYEDVDFHVWNGDFEISGVEIKPKAGIIDSVQNGNIQFVVSSKLNNLSIEGFAFWEYYKTKKLKIDEILIIKPEIKYSFNPTVKVKKSTFILSSLFTDRLKSVEVEKVNIQNAGFDFNNIKKKNILLDIDSMNVMISNLFLDSVTVQKPIPVIYSNFYLFVDKLSADLSAHYRLKSDKFYFESNKNLLEIEKINIIPKYSLNEFHKIIPYEKAYLSIRSDLLKVTGINVDSIINTGKFYFNKVLIKKPYISTYKDKRLKDPPNTYKKLLSQMIREIPLDFKIDTLKVENGFIKVQTIGTQVRQTEPGEITFNSVYLSVFGFTNDSLFIKKWPIMNLYFNSKFMGVADLKAQISMPIFHNRNNFKVKGELTEMDATVLSELLNRVLLVDIKSGKIRNIDFEFIADKDSALGYIDISYQDLKLDIKNKKKPNKSVKLMNALVNTVVKTNNIKGTPNFTRGFIKYKRDVNKKFINYLWLSIQNGIINTFVLSKEVKAQSKEFKKENKKGKNIFQRLKKKNKEDEKK